jgi:hypothetical protein
MANRVLFLVAEMAPNVDPFMLHIYASLAEKERALISERTRLAGRQAQRPETWHGRQRRDCSPRPSGQERTGDQSQRHHTGSYRGDPTGREDDAGGYRPGARSTRRPHLGRSRPLGAYADLAAAVSLGVCGPVRRPGLHRRAAERLPSSSATTVRLANSSAWALRCEPR